MVCSSGLVETLSLSVPRQRLTERRAYSEIDGLHAESLIDRHLERRDWST
jgi:hypothetical protein